MNKKIRQLQISFFRDKVKSSPDIRCGPRKCAGRYEDRIWILDHGKRKHMYRIKTAKGQELLNIKNECDKYKLLLLRLETEWVGEYGTLCSTVALPDYKNSPNRRLFDSLIVGRNPYAKEYKINYKNMIFRSKIEADFARTMDEFGIWYKYEPEIKLYNNRYRYPDFVIYLPWLDLLILVELFGRCDKEDYLLTVRDRSYDYMMSGWKPGINMLSFYYYDKDTYVPSMIMEEIETCALRNFLMNVAA